MSRVLRALMPCLRWKSRDDDAAGDAEDARARERDDGDDDGAAAALDALERREARLERARDEIRRSGGTRARGAGAARGRIDGAATRAVDASDSGPVEIALRALRSAQHEREIEREARERRERDGEPRLRDKVDGLGNANARGKRKLARERFACSLYAKRGGDDGKWANLGRRACEPSVAREGAMCRAVQGRGRRDACECSGRCCARRRGARRRGATSRRLRFTWFWRD